MNRRFVLPIVISIAVTLPGRAQLKQSEIAPLVERVEVSVTTVDAYVTDRSGRPVSGLSPEDFEVFEDGRRQQITGFYVIENGQTRSSTPAGEDPRVEVKADQFRRKVVLMIDNNSIGKIPRDSAIETVQKFIENQFEEDYEWSVINVGAKAETVQPFTNQKSEVDAALLRVRQSPTFELQREMDRRILSDPARAKLRETEFASGYSFEESVRFQGREQTMRNLRATINAARAVIQTCRAYSAAGGKKLLLLVSGGMEMNTSFTAYYASTDRHLREMKREMELVLDTMVREANAANFSIYVVNPTSLAQRAPQHDVEHRAASGTVSVSARLSEGGSSQPVDISDRDSASLTLTSGTGGRYLPANDVAQSMRVIGDETGNFYSLAYSPSHKNDGKYHRIDVRVKAPGMNVRHREGYVDLSPEQRLEQSLRSPITFAKEKGTLPVNLELGPPQAGDKGKLVLPLTAQLPMRSLTLFHRERRQLGRVHVYLAVYDQAGTNVGFNHLVQDITIPEEQLQQVLGQEFRYTMKVGLKRGHYTLVVTLRDDLSNEIGTALREVHL